MYQPKTPVLTAALTVAEIVELSLFPFTQTSGWKNVQEADSTLAKIKHHIGGGTIPISRIRGSSELKKLYTHFQLGKRSLNNEVVVIYVLRDNVGNTRNLIVVPTS